MANNGPVSERGSLYTVPADATGDARIYGYFKSQRILGYPCDIEVTSLPDNSPGVCDLLGYECVMRGDSAIHMSGFDPYGKKTGPGFIRAIGMERIHWTRECDREHPPAGLGAREPEPCIIATWDEDESGRGHRDESWQHFVFFGGPKAFLTLRGVHAWWRKGGYVAFDVRGLAEAIDAGRPSYLRTVGVAQHERAFRRLLDGHLGVSNNKLPRDRGQVVLQRVGRWGYTFAEGETT